LENRRHPFELFRRRAIYVEPEKAICQKAARQLTDLDLKDASLLIKQGCLHKYSEPPTGLGLPLSIDSNYGLGNFPAKVRYSFTEGGHGCVSGLLVASPWRNLGEPAARF